MRLRFVTILSLVVGILVTAGCGPTIYWRKSSPSFPIGKPSTGMAQVVFLNPSVWWDAGIMSILEAPDGRFIGQTFKGIAFAAPATPGEHFYVAQGPGTNAIRVNVVAGKTYYVEVSGRWDGVHLIAIKPSIGNWPNLQKWLAEERLKEIDVTAGQQDVDLHHNIAIETIEKGRKTWAGYSAQLVSERSLAAADGQ